MFLRYFIFKNNNKNVFYISISNIKKHDNTQWEAKLCKHALSNRIKNLFNTSPSNKRKRKTKTNSFRSIYACKQSRLYICKYKMHMMQEFQHFSNSITTHNTWKSYRERIMRFFVCVLACKNWVKKHVFVNYKGLFLTRE